MHDKYNKSQLRKVVMLAPTTGTRPARMGSVAGKTETHQSP